MTDKREIPVSDTTRTDALWIALMRACRTVGIAPTQANDLFVLCDDFRQLERELAAMTAERDRLQKQFNTVRESHEKISRHHLRLGDQIEDLTARAEAAERDVRRVDWLEKNSMILDKDGYVLALSFSQTLREGIDAAMKKSEGTGNDKEE